MEDHNSKMRRVSYVAHGTQPLHCGKELVLDPLRSDHLCCAVCRALYSEFGRNGIPAAVYPLTVALVPVEESSDDYLDDHAMQVGMGLGVDAYNEARGYA